MSETAIYAPLGHGGLLVHRGEYIWRRVPPGCIFITLVYSASLSYTVYIERFQRGLKDPAFVKALQNPTDPDNYVTLREYMEEMPFNINANRHPTMEEHGVLAVLQPGDEYPEAHYMLTGSHHDNTVLLDSGFYNTRTLQKKPIRDFGMGEHPGLISKDELSSCYKGSLIPTAPTLLESLASDASLEVLPGYYRIADVDRAVRAWPFNINDSLESIIGIAERYLERLIIALTDGDRRTVGQYQKLLREYHTTILAENTQRVRQRLEKSGVTVYPIVQAFIEAVDSIGDLESKVGSADYQRDVIQLFDVCRRLKIPRVDQQRPGNMVQQSFLFENFPGIHVNVLCRAVGRGELPGKKIEEQRARSAGRTAARYNAAIARATTGRERLPPLNVVPSNYPQYRAEQAAQRATAMRILEAQRAGPNKYVRNISRRAQNRQLIASLRATGASENYIRSLFPTVAPPVPQSTTVRNIRRTIRGQSNSNTDENVVFVPRATRMTRRRSNNRSK